MFSKYFVSEIGCAFPVDLWPRRHWRSNHALLLLKVCLLSLLFSLLLLLLLQAVLAFEIINITVVLAVVLMAVMVVSNGVRNHISGIEVSTLMVLMKVWWTMKANAIVVFLFINNSNFQMFLSLLFLAPDTNQDTKDELLKVIWNTACDMTQTFLFFLFFIRK